MAPTRPPSTGPTGLLLAMMEPPATLEAEFQQWYDTEHFPEREGCEGFLTANRYVCIDGWPRYLALYDLADVNVLRGPAYAKIAVDRYSVWTERIISSVWGQYRVDGAQVYPGSALLGAKGHHSRLAIMRFRDIPGDMTGEISEALRSIYEKQPETAQLRVFNANFADGQDALALIELHAPWTPPSAELKRLGRALRHLDMVNVYTRYQRRWPGQHPKNT